MTRPRLGLESHRKMGARVGFISATLKLSETTSQWQKNNSLFLGTRIPDVFLGGWLFSIQSQKPYAMIPAPNGAKKNMIPPSSSHRSMALWTMMPPVLLTLSFAFASVPCWALKWGIVYKVASPGRHQRVLISEQYTIQRCRWGGSKGKKGGTRSLCWICAIWWSRKQ